MTSRTSVSEHSIQRTILAGLTAHRIPHWRINVAAVVGEHRGKRRFFRSAPNGFPDIVVLWPHRGVGFIEVKSAKGRLTEAQREFRDLCTRHGVLHVVARSWDDVAAML